MINDDSVTIKIEYKLDGSETWEFISLSPEDYFDLDEYEQIEIDCIPKYNYAIDYIEQDKEKIINTKITITDKNSNKEKIFLQFYWNKQQNSIVERIDSGENYNDNEIIIETKIQESPPKFEIMRLIRKDGFLAPIYHGFITDNNDGSQTEIQVI